MTAGLSSGPTIGACTAPTVTMGSLRLDGLATEPPTGLEPLPETKSWWAMVTLIGAYCSSRLPTARRPRARRLS